MKDIITIIFLGLIVMSCKTSTGAEEQMVEESGAEKQVINKVPERNAYNNPEQIAALLGLSNEKTGEFVEMWTSTRDEMKALRDEYKDGDRAEMFSKLRVLKEERDLALQSILTPPQLKEYLKIMKQRRGKRPKAIRKGSIN